MNLLLNDEQTAWQTHCHRFAADVIRPTAAELDREARFPHEILGLARNAGLYDSGLLVRLGQDPDGQFAPIYAEELHWGCAGVALALGAATAVVGTIAMQGTTDQFELWAPRCYGGPGAPGVAAYALSELHAGSDVSALRTLARPSGEDWMIDGSKVMINNAGIAEVTLVVAAVEPSLGHAGQATFLIEKGTRGMSASAPLPKLGVRASHTADLCFERCRVPGAALLGGREALERRLARARAQGKAPTVARERPNALAAAEVTRPLFAAGAVGIARAAYEWTVERLGELPASAQPFAEQVVADVASELDAARALVRRAAALARAGVPLSGGEGSMSKLRAAETAVWSISALMDLIGPFAGSNECPLGKWLRDAKAFQILEGTSQIQRKIIARLQLAHASAQ